MSLIERWDALSDETKELVKKFGVFSLLLFVVLSVLRALVPLAIISVGGYWAYKWLAQNTNVLEKAQSLLDEIKGKSQ